MFKVLKDQKNSNDEQIDELLSAYLDGALAAEDRVMIEVRLRQEPALVTRLDGLRQTKKALANLPQVAVPRNFILSPAMVAVPKPAAEQRRRRSWPVFGWATAAVTLLFLLVFAGDLFVVDPSLRTDQADHTVPTLGVLGETATAPGAEPEMRALEGSSAELETPLPAMAEEALLAPESPPLTLEADAMPEAESVSAVPEPLPAEGIQPEAIGTEAVVEAEISPTLEVEFGMTQTELAPAATESPVEAPAASIAEKTTQDAVSTTAEVEIFAVEATSEAASTSVAADAAATVEELDETVLPSPAAELAQTQDAQSTAASIATEEQMEQTVTEDAATIRPDVTPLAVDTGRAEQAAPGWLLPLEVGLAATALILAATTLLLRWRGV